MVKKLFALITVMTLCFGLVPSRMAEASGAGLLITEIQVGVGNERNEFVEIYNPNSAALSVEGLRVEYLSSSFSGDLSTQTRMLAVYSGTIPSKGLLLVRNDLYIGAPVELLNADRIFGSPTDNPSTGFLAYSGGYLRIVSNSNQLVDCVRWGGSESSTLPGCQRVAAPHTSDQNSLQRPLVNSEYQVSQGLIVSAMTPRTLINTVTEPDPEPEPVSSCLGVSINEVLPNPSGDDSGKEYIELLNPTKLSIDVSGCVIKVGSSQQILSGFIEPGYKVVYGLTLPNSAGGEIVWGSDSQVISQSYPPDLGDDEAYGVLDGIWHQGLVPTPGIANQLKSNKVANTTISVDELESCPLGKYRNPETNRCRNVVTASSTLAPCKPNENRNPDTNRCRKNSSSSSTLTICKEGYERNAETNRCRKVAAAKTTNPLANPAKTGSKPVSYMVLGIVGLLAIGYGAYEYRQNILNVFTKRRWSA